MLKLFFNLHKSVSVPGKIKINFYFVKFMATKNGKTTNFPASSFLVIVGSNVWDPWHFGMDPNADLYPQIRLWLMYLDVDPDLALDPDPDPVFFVIDLQDANKKTFFYCFFFLNVHLHHFSKIKSHNKVTKTVEINFFFIFLLVDGRIWILSWNCKNK